MGRSLPGRAGRGERAAPRIRYDGATMLTRLHVKGFKNLVDVDISFGPFTCIAGANATGKSNLFDAIRFLSNLANKPIVDAAAAIRDDSGRTPDFRGLFHFVPGYGHASEMSFQAEFIIPPTGVDDFGQQATATSTFLRYELTLRLRPDPYESPLGPIEVVHESLAHIPFGKALEKLAFPHNIAWRRSAVKNRRTAPFFISTSPDGSQVKIHADTGSDSGGRPIARNTSTLPRTVLSSVNSAESQTALLAGKEMQAWHALQLEPGALRREDNFTDPPRIRSDGRHLPATLNRLLHTADAQQEDREALLSRLSNSLAQLVDEVRSIDLDRDEKREVFRIEVTDAHGARFPARSLSDGTLRFLALALLQEDLDWTGVLCLEEPENGIHPERIPAILKLLNAIAVSTDLPLGIDNPLRQVIVNTHSPIVVSHVADDSLVVASLEEAIRGGHRFKQAVFRPLPGTWRQVDCVNCRAVSKAQLLAYLNPLSATYDYLVPQLAGKKRPTRVMDRPDLQAMLPWE